MKPSFALLFLLFFTFGYSQEKFEALAVQKFQEDLNAHYANPKTSPLTASDLAHFEGLDFFPSNPRFFVIAQFTRTQNEKPFKMKTSTARKPLYIKYGEISFVMDQKSFKLNVYQNVEHAKNKPTDNHLFLPFSDLSSGKESYIGGKYLDLKIPEGTTIAIDFNTSYNPYCAYNYQYSCPKVPLENRLDIAILAGVKNFKH
ncbi:DUF1684 domain-containing protein [Flavobacterium crassostreae]|uniref:DUF1684 domain-containing protein n=1 Tax=Flavobacterium crassostreae TaxID=1763534 RepID=A0A1B9E2H6_9FLAO|nr:DUF1684 domain-containing protein [Flavobacterium crassostreae]OCB76143.1 hypothetical protein LPBF_07485 [Flavobacterium crassostreae]